ncbi:hypothetical protein GCM10023074_15630 [Microbispora amethystogenes]|uniref:Uncharacterized protein n=1 Tax=Microbispora amethystogenes TaxID=1427754 RepID=A0ABQ4F7E1_9ACTN|nr:hypothetical protein Mam01_08780 [Microbispora amethystogenes]
MILAWKYGVNEENVHRPEPWVPDAATFDTLGAPSAIALLAALDEARDRVVNDSVDTRRVEAASPTPGVLIRLSERPWVRTVSAGGVFSDSS